jgi:hypothetical protein
MVLAASLSIEDVAFAFGGILFIVWIVHSRITITLLQETQL